MKINSRIVAGGGVAALGAVVAPSLAFGAFGAGKSNIGSSVGAATVAAVTNVRVTPQSATSIEVSWSPPTSQLSGVKYGVINNTSSTEPCTGLDSSTTTCLDAGVLAGQSYSYSVVAYLSPTSWTAAPPAVSSSTPDVFSFTAVPSQVAGSSFNVTLTAKRATSATNSALVTDTAYNYPSGRSITFTGPIAAPNGTKPSFNGSVGASVTTPVSFTSGVSAAVPVILYAAATSTSITATDPTTPAAVTATSNSFAVGTAQTPLGFGTSCSSFRTKKNTSTATTVTRPTTDAYGNTVTLPAVNVTLSGNNGSWGAPGTTSFSANGTATGSVTWTNVNTASVVATPTASASGYMSVSCSITTTSS